jgi:hypothetical protein
MLVAVAAQDKLPWALAVLVVEVKVHSLVYPQVLHLDALELQIQVVAVAVIEIAVQEPQVVAVL